MSTRKVIRIDEDLCDGCGLCAPSCQEGAIAIVDGKARLVNEVYCDGLGACLGECPQGAIAIEERQAAEFDQTQVEEHLARLNADPARPTGAGPAHDPAGSAIPGLAPTRDTEAGGPGAFPSGGCPSSAVRSFERATPPEERGTRTTAPAAGDKEAHPFAGRETALGHWPVKIALVPPKAPFLRGADLVVAADCAPFACPDFHESILAGKAVVIGCPKLDDANAHQRKLASIFRESGVRRVQVVHMEVPCCFALVHIVRGAMKDAGVDLGVTELVLDVRGKHGAETAMGEGHDLLRTQIASALP